MVRFFFVGLGDGAALFKSCFSLFDEEKIDFFPGFDSLFPEMIVTEYEDRFDESLEIVFSPFSLENTTVFDFTKYF